MQVLRPRRSIASPEYANGEQAPILEAEQLFMDKRRHTIKLPQTCKGLTQISQSANSNEQSCTGSGHLPLRVALWRTLLAESRVSLNLPVMKCSDSNPSSEGVDGTETPRCFSVVSCTVLHCQPGISTLAISREFASSSRL